jgi:3-hydroxyisobutyrate dehydrogenase-like beta-hydroxyacid dehydrogenase
MNENKGSLSMQLTKIGIIGYGEVGRALAQGLSTGSGLTTYLFDVRFNDEIASNPFIAETRKQGLIAQENIEALVKNSTCILSAVTCEHALNVAKASCRHLGGGKIFVDLNTVAPRVKKKMSVLVAETGAAFVEIAILGTIASYGFKSPMLACGNQAEDLAAFLNPMGFNLKVLSGEIGQASTMKMLRSVFAKGVESLLFEMLVAAEKCNMLEPVMDAVAAHMDKSPFLDIAQTWITTNVVHARRRAEEMDHVIETLRDLEVSPIMSEATRQRLRKCSELNLIRHLDGRQLSDYRDVIRHMVRLNYD